PPSKAVRFRPFSFWRLPQGTTTLELVTSGRSVLISSVAVGQLSDRASVGVRTSIKIDGDRQAARCVRTLEWLPASRPDDRRRAVGVKRLDRLQPPCLPLLAFLLGPDDRLPIRRQDEARAGIGDFDPVAAGLVDIEEEGLLDGVLVRPGLDVDPVLQEDVGCTQDLLAAVERIGDVM